MTTKCDGWLFPLKLVMWGAEQLLAVASSAGAVLHSFSCPLHCGGSCFPWLIAGVCLGFSLSLCLVVVLWVKWTSLDFCHPATSSHPQHPARDFPRHPRRRLSAYLE